MEVYDLVVIGGGSGGLACSKRAQEHLGEDGKVAVLDFVKPSWQGTSWGLGGTCVNVGCIPKKLMHQAALLGDHRHDAKEFGWEEAPHKCDWETLRQNVGDHIRGLNWGYKTQLRSKGVTYLNRLGSFGKDANTIELVDKKGEKSTIGAKQVVIAVGGRPRNLNIPGAEHTVSSDDIFSLEKSPGKTLCIGASYISLECAGFLAGIGLDVTVMVRSILLRGFDKEMANLVGEGLEHHKVKFLKTTTPKKIEKLDNGKLKVTFISRGNGEDEKESEGSDVFDTVLVAIGRNADTGKLNLENAGVKVDPKSKKVVGGNGSTETSSCKTVHAVGDCLEGSHELTPVAIQAGKLLADRLFTKSKTEMDYDMVATAVFTPIEYGAIGLSEEDAKEKFGEADIEVYATEFIPLEWTVPHRDEEMKGFAKLVCVKSQQERVVGFHYFGPNAGEVTQGYALGVKLGATKADFDNVVGIHPTTAETFTTMDKTKSSGASLEATGC